MAEKVFLGGLTNTTLHIESDGTLHIEEKIDAQPILDWTQACRDHRFGSDDDFGRYEGEVPVTEYLKECRRRGMDHHKAMQLLGTQEGDLILLSVLYAPENAKMRAAPVLRDPRIIMKGSR